MRKQQNQSPSLWIALSFALSVAISNGLARFAYGLVLPAMREDLGWSYSVAGFLNTANAVGYLLGAFSGYAWLRRVDPERLFKVGLCVVVLALCATPISEDIAYLSTMRAIAGVGSAWLFTCGAALVSLVFAHDKRTRGIAVGIYFSGAGIGMIASGLTLAPLLEQLGPGAWRTAWHLVAIASAALAVLPYLSATKVDAPAGHSTQDSPEFPFRAYALPLAAYLLFGAGNNIYITFLAAWIAERGESWFLVSAAWSVLGAGICLSPFLWARALNNWPATKTQAWAQLATACGVALALVGSGEVSMLLSALLFGCALFIVPSSVTLLARSTRPASDLPKVVALFTTMFSVGQALGPWVAGAASDVFGLSYGIGIGLCLLVVAGALANAPSQARTLARASVNSA